MAEPATTHRYIVDVVIDPERLARQQRIGRHLSEPAQWSLHDLADALDGTIDEYSIEHVAPLLAGPAPADVGMPLYWCLCGRHFECPDGHHEGVDLPCLCTPDCLLEEVAS